MNGNLQKLYNNLRNDYGDNFNVDYSAFLKDMEDDSKRNRLYENMRQDYGDNFTRSFEDFSNDIGFGAPYYLRSNNQYDTPLLPQPQFQPAAEQDFTTGFVPGFKQGVKALEGGSKVVVGNLTNLISGSSRDADQALDILARYGNDSDFTPQKSYRQDIKNRYEADLKEYKRQMDEWYKENPNLLDRVKGILPFGNAPKKPDNPFVSGETLGTLSYNRPDLRPYRLAAEALKQSGGDIESAVSYLSKKTDEKTWGDKVEAEAFEELSQLQPTKGVGAWVGNLLPQMIPNAAAIAASAHPATRSLARPLGALGMAVLSASSGGSAIMEARQYADEKNAHIPESEVLSAGAIATAIEIGTEMIPFSRYLSGAGRIVKKRLGSEVSRKIIDNPAARKEADHLLKKAAGRIPGRLSKKTLSEYTKDLTAETLSEFAAESLGTLVPLIYSGKEDYPKLYDIVLNGIEGAKGGLFMGAFLGGGSRIVNNYTQNQRRKQQGVVTFADIGNGVVEILGEKNNGYVVLNEAGEVIDLPKAAVQEMATVKWDEFKKYAEDLSNKKGSALPGNNADSAQPTTDQILENILNPVISDDLDPGDPSVHIETRMNILKAKQSLDGMMADADYDFNPSVIDLPVNEQKIVMAEVLRDEMLTNEQKQSIVNYLSSASFGRQLQIARQSQLNDQMQQIEADLKRNVNKKTGTLITGSIMGLEGEPVQIIDGLAVKLNEASSRDPYLPDIDNSDDAIYYLDQDGKTQVTTADRVKVNSNVDVSAQLEIARLDLIAEAKQREVEIDAAVRELMQPVPGSFHNWVIGETAKLPDGGGIAQIMQFNRDGSILLEIENSNDVVTEKNVSPEDMADFGFSVPENGNNKPESGNFDTENGNNQVEKEILREEEEYQSFIDSLPVIESGKNQGQIDQDRMAPEQTLQYFDYTYGKEQTLSAAEKQVANLKKIFQKEQGKLDSAPFNIAQNEKVAAIERELKIYSDYVNNAKLASIEQRMKDHAENPTSVLEDRQARAEEIAQEEAVRTGTVSPVITEKWDTSPKVEGQQDVITLANGEKISGRYVLTSAGAPSPSHDINRNYAKTEGFPVNEQGKTVNDRDYETDKTAQLLVEQRANNYDERAVQTPVVVSSDGIVLSGNDRTMSGQLAAQKGTDGAYVDYINRYASRWGFTAEQVGAMSDPRIVFVPDVPLPYNTSTFAKFNAEEKKTQNSLETAIKASKSISRDAIIPLAQTIEKFEKLNDFYSNPQAVKQAVQTLLQNGIIQSNEVPRMMDGEMLSVEGRSFLETLMLGSVLQEEALREVDKMRSARQTLMRSMPQLLRNASLREYSLINELNNAIHLLYKAKQSGNAVRLQLIQGNLFDATAEEIYAEAEKLLSLMLESEKDSDFRSIFDTYNNKAAAIEAGQVDLFEGILSKSELLQQIINSYGQKTESNQQIRPPSAVDQRSEESGERRIQSEGKQYDRTEGPTQIPEPISQGARRKSNAVASRVEEKPADNRREIGSTSQARQVVEGVGGKQEQLNALEVWAKDKGFWFDDISQFGTELARGGENEVYAFNDDKVIKLNNFEYAGDDAVNLFDRLDVHNFLFPRVKYTLIGFARNSEGEISAVMEQPFVVSANRLATTGEIAEYMRGIGFEQVDEDIYRNNDYEVFDAYPNNVLLGADGLLYPIDTQIGKNAQNQTAQEKIEKVASEIDTNPTEAQKEAGNYKKGHVTVQGFDITIENPKGSVRSGVDENGKQWSIEMQNHYGYFKRTEGKDGDQIDVFIGPNPESKNVFVVDQVNPESKDFDESKVMLGFNSAEEAKAAYLLNYEEGWQGLGAITESNVEDFKKWLYDGAKQRKPYSEYKSVKQSDTGIPASGKTADAYGSSNTLISPEKYEELRRRMRDKLNNLNVGFDPELFTIGTQMAAYHIEAGARKFADFAKRMTGDLGENIRPYLKSFYESARHMPGMEDIAPQMDTPATVKYADANTLTEKKDKKPREKSENVKQLSIFEVDENLNDNNNARTLQANSQRLPERKSSESLQGIYPGRTGRNGDQEGREISKNDEKQQRSADGRRSVLSRHADVSINEQPALVEFNAESNDEESFNKSRKYADNISAIETLLTILNENRKATPEEKTILSKYVGFGGLKEILQDPENDSTWKDGRYRDQVRRIIELSHKFDRETNSTDTFSKIRGSILNAHYTPKTVIEAIYKGLNKLGFKSGNILEPSAGIGNFISYMPEGIKGKSNISAVELDKLTGYILHAIHDSAHVHISGIEYATIPDNSQDLIISNVPFGNYKVYDRAFKGDREQFLNRIHNYFFAKALDKAREGGIIAFVTSKGVLDSPGNENLREYLSKNADFLGAVRLPNNAFVNTANTQVVTDIIFLRKNSNATGNANFVKVAEIEAKHKDGESEKVTVNQYFIDNPQNMMGDIEAGGLYDRSDYTLNDNGTAKNIANIIKEALPANIYQKSRSAMGLQANDLTGKIETVKEGNILLSDGQLYRKEEGVPVAIKLNYPVEKIQRYIALRDALMELIYSEYANFSPETVKANREKLNKEYDNFKKEYGKLEKSINRISKLDADGYNVLSLENDGQKADIFTKRTINPVSTKNRAESIDEAIIISLSETAGVDMERIGQLTGMTFDEVKTASKGKIFERPEGGHVTRDEYLSGNVKRKLAEAKQAVESGYTEFQNNVDELERVIPADIPAIQIESRLGSRWIPASVYSDFAKHLLNDKGIGISYSPGADQYFSSDSRLATVEATQKYGSSRVNGVDILLSALHINPPKVYDYSKDQFGNQHRELNKEETDKAVQKYQDVRDLFEDWVYKSPDRRELLSKIYNSKFNTSVKRKYDGTHLNVPGINGVELRPHQKDAVWMLLQNNGGVIDHLVGAGKTYVMVAGTMEMKRTGTAKKPMIIALKSTIPQIVKAYRSAYPLAKILAPMEKDFVKENRRKLFSKIANNEWDIIIMSHENYGKIPHETDIQEKLISEEISQLEAERAEFDNNNDRAALKGLEIRIKNLNARLEKLSDISKDNSLTFEQMGIDHIMVDESQQFKNLSYITKQRGIAGLGNAEGSKRSFNLLTGVRYLQDKLNGDRGVTFLSGTPITNSIVEMYSLLNYLRPGKMDELGFTSFDAWATTFANPTTDIEFTVTGNFKQKTRFREFMNVPELSMLYTEIADIRTDDNLKLDKPHMKGNGYSVVEVQMSDDQKEFAERLMKFAETKDGKLIGRGELSDNEKSAAMLLATNLSSKMAIDMRLINTSYPYDPNGKIAKLVNNVVEYFNNSKGYNGTQLIFSDLGTPKNAGNKSALLRDYLEDEVGLNIDDLNQVFGDVMIDNYRYPSITAVREKMIDVIELTDEEADQLISDAENSASKFDVYNEIKKRLIERGIPADQVVFIHDYNTARMKEALFDKVNNGQIRIILGSTQKLGTGVNVQERVVAVHHIDVPWTPASMEQRNGRALRQGNKVAKEYQNDQLPVFAYATERTLDAYKYQLLQTKQTFLNQVKSGEVIERVIKEGEGDSESGVGYAELVAMLSGNQDILQKSRLEEKLNRFKRAKRNFEGELYDAIEQKRRIEERIPEIEENIRKSEQNVSAVTNKAQFDEYGKLVINSFNGEEFKPKKEKNKEIPAERTDYAKAAIDHIEKRMKKMQFGEFDRLNIGGYDIEFNAVPAAETGLFSTEKKANASVVAPNGVKYAINVSAIPGVLLNNIQKAVKDQIPNALKSQQNLMQRERIALASYNEIITRGDAWPKQAEMDAIAKELKEVTERLNVEAEAAKETALDQTGESTERFRPKDYGSRAAFAQREWNRAKNALKEITDRLGVDVEVLETTDGLTGKKATAKGWYDPKTGKITIVMPNHSNSWDVQATLLHEAVGHHGLRKLFGEHFDTFLDNVFDNADYGIQWAILDIANKENVSRRVATEEYLSRLAEDRSLLDDEGTGNWLGRIRQFFFDMLAKVGFNVDFQFSDNELRYILWRSFKNLAEPGRYSSIVEHARDVTMQSKLNVGDFAKVESPVSDVAENKKTVFRENDTEIKRIKEQSIADGTFMKAPNGEPTNLNEGQWLQVRTKAFKEWFGDWEKTARIEKLRESKPVEITGKEYQGQYELNRESSQKYILDNFRNEYTIKDTNDKILISKIGAKKVTSHSMGNEAHLKSVAVIPEMIENSIFIEERKAEKNDPHYDIYRYYVTGLKIGKDDYTVKITVGIREGKKYYDHSLTEIEKNTLIDQLNAQPKHVPNNKGVGEMTLVDSETPTSDIKDTKLVSILQTNSSKFVDENGEPSGEQINYFSSQNKPETNNTGAFDFENDDIRFRRVSSSGFYSTVEDALERIDQEKGTKEQFQSMLLKNGAKQAELYWMGFDDLPAKLTRQDIKVWIDANRIEIEEVEKNKGNGVTQPEWINYDDVELDAWTTQIGKYHFNIVEIDNAYSLYENGFMVDIFDTLEEAQRSAELVYEPEEIDQTKYAEYTLPGGEDYKELILVLPRKIYEVIDPKTGITVARFETDSDAEAFIWEQRLNNGKEYVYSLSKKINKKFNSTHFDESNVLAHVRFNERTLLSKGSDRFDTDYQIWVEEGKKGKGPNPSDYGKDGNVLFIEELQSDWAQEGRKIGFAKVYSSEIIPPSKDMTDKGDYDYRGIIKDETGRVVKSFKDFNLPKVERLINEGIDRFKKLSVPAMPFKNTDQWLNLAFRRMMRYAAENGFDRIAWTTGEQQADRYDLSRQIDRVEYKKKTNDFGEPGYEIDVFDTSGNIIIREGSASLVRVESLLGKEIAQKIANGKDTGTLIGVDLKIGGEGLKWFYDQIVRKAAGKLGKSFGAKVETIKLPEIGTQLSLPVTEIMKRSVMKGVPLFRSVSRNEMKNAEERFDIAKTEEEKYEAVKDISAFLDNIFSTRTGTIVVRNNNELADIFESEGDSYFSKEIRKKEYQIQGVHDPTGKVYINSGGVESSGDIFDTWLHENMHQFNQENNENVLSLLGKIDESIFNEVLPEDYLGLDEVDKIDEFLAFLTEDFTSGKKLPQNDVIRNAVQPIIEKYLNQITDGQFSKSNSRLRGGRETVQSTHEGEPGSVRQSFGGIEKRDKANKPQPADRNIRTSSKGVSDTEEYGSAGVAKGERVHRKGGTVTGDEGVNAGLRPPIHHRGQSIEEFARKVDEFNRKRNESLPNNREFGAADDGNGVEESSPKYAGEPVSEYARVVDDYNKRTGIRYRVTLNRDNLPKPPVLHAGMSSYDVAYLVTLFRTQTDEVFTDVSREMAKISLFHTTFIDRARPLEKYQALMVEKGASMTQETNAYADYITNTSRATHLIQEYNKTLIEPLQNTLRKIVNSGKLKNLQGYRWNIVDEATGKVLNGKDISDYDRMSLYLQAKDIVESDQLRDTGAKGIAKRGSEGFEGNVKDTSGNGVPASTYIAEFENAVGVTTISEIWEKVRSVNKWALDLQLQYGLITREVYDEYNGGDRKYYVPQRGWRERDLSGNQLYYAVDKGETPDNPFNAALVKARGRTTLAGDPLAYMQSIGESSVMAALKNQTKQKFLQFAEDNSDFARVHGFFGFRHVYYVNTGKFDENGNAIYERSYEAPTKEELDEDKIINENLRNIKASEIEARINYVNQKLSEEAYERLLKSLKKKEADLQSRIHVKYADSEASRIAQVTAKERKQHIVLVLREGKEYEIVFTKNYNGERVANVLNRNFVLIAKSIRKDKGLLIRAKDSVENSLVGLANFQDENFLRGTRFMSSMITQYNPTFAVGNGIRDFGIGSVSNLTEFGVMYQLRFMRNIGAVQPSVWNYVVADQWGGKNEYRSGYYGKMLKEFFEDGAATGWSFLKDIDQLRTSMKRAITPTALDAVMYGKAGITNVLGLKHVFGMLTEVSELTTRFAEYVTSREEKNDDGGLKYSRQEAAIHAKEISVNFDRMGNQKFFGTLFSFFNASIQGTNKLFRLIRDPKVRKRMIGVAATLMAGGLLQSLLMPDPDDDEERLFTEWELMQNICFGKLKVPLPQGLRAFWGIGTQAGLAARGSKGIEESILDGTNYFLGELIPEQFVFWMNGLEIDEKTENLNYNPTLAVRGAIPTTLQPLYDVWQNMNFLGGTSYRTEFTNAQKNTKAERTLGKRNVSEGAQLFSNAMWLLGGGDLSDGSRLKKDDTSVVSGIFDWNPSAVESLTRGYAAGTGKFALDMVTLGQQIFDPERRVDVSTMAISNVLWKQPREYSVLDNKLRQVDLKLDFYKSQFNDIKKNNRERYGRITSFHSRENMELRRDNPVEFEKMLRKKGTKEQRMFDLLYDAERFQKMVAAGQIGGKAAEQQADVFLGLFRELQ